MSELEQDGTPLVAMMRRWSLRRTLGMSGGVLVLIVVGVLVGGVVWPRAVSVEQKVVAPMRRAAVRLTLEERLPDMIDTACPAIVSLAVPPAAPGGAPSPVNGILISDDGYILTVGANVDSAATIDATLSDGRKLGAAFKGNDPVSGLTLLKIDATNLSTFEFADGDFPRIGVWGFALSSPRASGCAIHTGLIASDFAVDGDPRGAYLRVEPVAGNETPGAPFIGADGKVIGLVTTDPGDGGTALLPGKVIARVASDLLRGEPSPSGAFGILADDMTPVLAKRLNVDRQRGAVIVMIAPKSAADKAGLQVGDVILSAGQSPISGASELTRALDTDSWPIALRVVHGKDQREVTLSKKS